MNMRTISALAVLTLAAGGTIAALPSNAVKVPTSVTKATVTGVAPITCRYSTSCVLDFVNQAGNTDFWRARQASQPNGPWVRLTLVNGN